MIRSFYTFFFLAILMVFSPLMTFMEGISFRVQDAKAAGVIITWDGGGANNNWTTSANWSDDTVPTSEDTVVFNATSVKDLTVNTAVNVTAIDIQAGYTGSISQGANTIATTTYTQTSGTFTGGSSNVIIRGDFSLTGGTFTSTSETLIVTGSFNTEGGTFNHNNGTLTLASAEDTTLHTLPTLNNLNISSASNEGLVGWWKFDEGIGTTANDSSGSDNHGTLTNGPTWTSTTADISSLNPYALEFDGVDDYVSAGDAANVDFDRTDAFSISAFVSITASGVNHVIASKMSDSAPFRGWMLYRDSGSKLRFLLRYDNSPSDQISVTVPYMAFGGVYRHIAVTYDGSSDASGVKVYVDGSVISTITDVNTLTNTTLNSSSFNIGSRNDGNNVMEGFIDDVRIYDRALLIGETAALAGGASGENPVTYTLSSNLDIVGNLTINYSTLDLAGYNLTLGESSTFSSIGTLKLQGDETLTNFENDTDSGTIYYTGNSTYNSLIAGNTYYNLTINGSGAFTPNSDTTVNNDFILTNGTFNAPSILNISNLFTNSSTFNHNNGTVNLTGTDQQLTGNTTFYNLSKQTTGTLTLPANATQTIANTLTLKGSKNNSINLRSSIDGQQFNLNPQGTSNLAYLNVQDSKNINAQSITCPTTCLNQGNNTNWTFLPTPTPTSTVVPVTISPIITSINQLFRTVYGQTPTYQEWRYWTNRLKASPLLTASELLGAMQYQKNNFNTSPVATAPYSTSLDQPIIKDVNSLFRQTYGRTPTQKEWQYWSDRVLKADHQTTEQILGAMQYHKTVYNVSASYISPAQINAVTPSINQVFRQVFHHNPTRSQWEVWHSKIVRGLKTTVESLLGAMQWWKAIGN